MKRPVCQNDVGKKKEPVSSRIDGSASVMKIFGSNMLSDTSMVATHQATNVPNSSMSAWPKIIFEMGKRGKNDTGV